MKLILRADDLGFSEGVNFGIYKSIKDGVITSVGMMPNMKTAEHGYDLIKNFDIALGQHTNICVGKPLSDPKIIPSLVNEDGEFCSSTDIRSREKDTIDIKECEIEIEAQLQRFRKITGKDPDYFEGHAVFSQNFFMALQNIAKKHNLFFCNPGIDKNWETLNGIYSLGFSELNDKGLYDPKEYFESSIDNLKKNECSIAVFHPGYLDQYLLNHSSFTFIRAMECDFLCGGWIKKWLKEHDIKLIDFRNYKE